jgi:hypothetical protein
MCSNHHLAHITVSVLTAAVEVDVLLAAADVALPLGNGHKFLLLNVSVAQCLFVMYILRSWTASYACGLRSLLCFLFVKWSIWCLCNVAELWSYI